MRRKKKKGTKTAMRVPSLLLQLSSPLVSLIVFAFRFAEKQVTRKRNSRPLTVRSVCLCGCGWVVLLTARTHGIKCCITHISRGNQSSSRHNCYLC